jgi:hypothetical protein
MNTFTRRQEKQIRTVLNRLMRVGAEHICLADAILDSRNDDGTEWYTIRAYVRYPLINRATGEIYRDDRRYEIRVGKYPDRRRPVLTVLNMRQHDLARAV